MSDFSTSLRAVAVAWLKGPIANALLTGPTTVINALGGWASEGVRARYPEYAPPDALGNIGNDRNIERGPRQSGAGYAAQLRKAFDTWRVAGNAGTVLRQVAAFFAGGVVPTLRAVSDSAIWHEYNASTDVVTKTVVGTNWTWDAFTGTRWWRGWIIIDSSGGPWTLDRWGSGAWGDGGVWGSSATEAEVRGILAIVFKWKPAHVHNVYVIITFDSSLFERTDASPPNPNGTSDTPAWRAPLGANFWPGIV